MEDDNDKCMPLSKTTNQIRTKLPGWDEPGTSAYLFFHRDDPIDWDKLLKEVRAMAERNKKELEDSNKTKDE